ncbi:MAG: hypothetical protein A2539_02315 [Elusimicrobia bacterium RIFOXYD2_FULL_34_15]|nr:MAG: hypothetical protein A2539_02315 [Elusimicrobia bacterium RIFOXYD2_FULL_34_15]
MKILTELFNIAFKYLVVLEVEKRIFRKLILRVIWVIVFVIVTFILILTAIFFLFAGIYQYFILYVSHAAAAIFVFLIASLLATLSAAVVKLHVR